MKEIIFDKNNYKDYKDMYKQIYKDLDGKNTIDWEDYDDLGYSANLLDEFLWYKAEENIKYIFKNFNLEKIEQEKTYDDYQFKWIIRKFKKLIEEYPNNAVEFK